MVLREIFSVKEQELGMGFIGHSVAGHPIRPGRKGYFPPVSFLKRRGHRGDDQSDNGRSVAGILSLSHFLLASPFHWAKDSCM